MKPFFSSGQLQAKICGIRSTEDALSATNLGADALGFNFYQPSKRYVPLETAVAIISSLPQATAYVAVVVNPTGTEIRSLQEFNLFDAIQFHGDESPGFCLESGFPIWIKAVRISDFDRAVETIRSFPTPYILLDADTDKAYGGTGTLIDLPLAAKIVHAFPEKHFLLAGGLRPENVREAALTVRPFAVDVASGVENTPGNKDPLKMRAFIEAVRTTTARQDHSEN